MLLALILATGPIVTQPAPVAPDVTVANQQDGGSLGVYVTGAATTSVVATPANVTAFAAARVAQPLTLLDSIHQYGLDLDEWGVLPDGGAATWLANEPAIRLSADAGQTAAIRTHQHLRYQAGKGQRVVQTVVLDGLTDAGQVYRWGTFDDSDGFGWRYSAAGLAVFIRSSTDGGVTDTVYLVDAGPDWVPGYGSIYDFDYQWLGVGTVRARLNDAALLSVVHSNTLPSPYTKTATLPVTFEAQGGTGDSVAQMKAICTSVQSEGGDVPPGLSFAERMMTEVTLAPADPPRPILSLRAAPTFNGAANRVQVVPTRVWCSSDTRRARFDLVAGPTGMAGAAFASVASTSAAQYDVSATSVDGGTLVGSFAVGTGAAESYGLEHIYGQLLRHLGRRAYLAPDGGVGLDEALQTVSIVASNASSGGNAVVLCGIEWQEVR